MKIILQFRNARTVVNQIRAGAWRPAYNSIAGHHLTATMDEKILWIGNGAWFCDIYPARDVFGLIWRHYVWWAAARTLKLGADMAYLTNGQGEHDEIFPL